MDLTPPRPYVASIHHLPNHQNKCLAWGPNLRSHMLATGCHDDAVRVWDLSRPNTRPRPLKLNDDYRIDPITGESRTVNAIEWCNDGSWLACGYDDGMVRIWSPRNSLIANFGENAEEITDLKLSKGAQTYLAYASAYFRSDRKAVGFVEVWNVKTLEPVHKFYLMVSGLVNKIEWKTNHLFAAYGWNKVIYICQIKPFPFTHRLFANAEHLGISWSPSGNLLASSCDDLTLNIWSPPQASPVSVIQTHHGDFNENSETIKWSPTDANMIATATDYTVHLWDVASGTPLYTLEAHETPLYDFQFSPDGQYVASIGGDDDHHGNNGLVKIYSTRTGNCLLNCPIQDSFTDLQWNARGDKIATVGLGSANIIDVRMNGVN